MPSFALRFPAALTVFVCIVIAGVACSASGASNDDTGFSIATVPLETAETPVVVLPDATATPASQQPSEDRLSGFIYPIVGGCLPQGDQLMPNAPRAYRGGTHEGVDFYNVDNCTAISVGTPVVAAKSGTVIRVDTVYSDPTPAEMADYLSKPNDPDALDKLRGQQVWIDHGNGIVTRYCHLSGVADGLSRGDRVTAGDLVGFVGESGTPESIENPGTEYHLHFEVRVGDSYLGKGQSPDQVRALFLALFR